MLKAQTADNCDNFACRPGPLPILPPNCSLMNAYSHDMMLLSFSTSGADLRMAHPLQANVRFPQLLAANFVRLYTIICCHEVASKVINHFNELALCSLLDGHACALSPNVSTHAGIKTLTKSCSQTVHRLDGSQSCNRRGRTYRASDLAMTRQWLRRNAKRPPEQKLQWLALQLVV